MSLSEFLEARISEDEDAAVNGGEYWEECYGVECRPRMEAECAAKRAIIKQCERLQEHANDLEAWGIDEHESILRALATVYADHPGYLPEWSA